MKHLGQIAIIAGVSLVGELLSFLSPLQCRAAFMVCF